MKFDTKTVLTLLFLGFVWGSAFILMKQGLKSFNYWQVASLRLVFAGSVAVFFFVKFFKTIERKDWIFLALAGTLGNLIPAYLFASANTEMPSSYSGALNALTPFFALISGVILFSQLFKVKQFLGIAIGLVGALSLIFTRNKGGVAFQHDFIVPCLKVTLAAMFYGINVNIIKSKLGHLSPIVNSMIPLTIIAVPALIIGLATGTVDAVSNPSALKSLGFIFILGVLGSAITLILFNELIKNTSALFASSVTYLIPVFAFMWGIIDGEPIGVFQMGGMALILGGITLTKK
ncbi:MAG TPA: DMT family transporter [Bacteroidia bacterium]